MAQQIIVENCKILFPNFSGRGDKYNPEGRRNFNLLLDEPMAEKLRDMGINVREIKSESTDEPREYRVKVNVNFESSTPPQVIMVTEYEVEGGTPHKKVSYLDRESVGILDSLTLSEADVTLSTYNYTSPMGDGVSLYLKTLGVKVLLDPIAAKYAGMDSGE